MGDPYSRQANSPAFKAICTGTVGASSEAIEGMWQLVGLAGADLDGTFRATRKSN